VALGAALAILVHGISGAAQDNIPVLVLVAPANFAAAFGLWRRSMRAEAAD